ncbi:MAG: hypothetical protein ACOX5Z_11035 [Desulfobulbus sp.]|jgi:hypothetical protein
MKELSTIVIISSLFFFILNIQAVAGEISQFSEIHSSELEDYSTYAFKFTNLSAQLKIIPTNGGHGSERTFNVDDFKLFQRNSHDYGNDDIFVGSVISLSSQEFKDFVDAIGNHPELQSIEDISDPNASLMIIREFAPNAICWEHLATEAKTRKFFDLLYNSIDPARQDIRDEIKRCKLHMGGQ